jgi:hypothetical protein
MMIDKKYTLIAPADTWEPVWHGDTSYPVYKGRIWNVPRKAVEIFCRVGFVLEGETPEGFEIPKPDTIHAKGSAQYRGW